MVKKMTNNIYKLMSPIHTNQQKVEWKKMLYDGYHNKLSTKE